MRATFAIKGQNPGARTLTVGAAFLVQVPVRDSGGEIDTARVLVTAGHVLDSIQGDTMTIALRRRLDGGRLAKDTALVPIRRNGEPMWTNPDPTLDLAVITFTLPAWADFDAVPAQLLATDSSLREGRVGPGDEARVLGFPFGIGGEQHRLSAAAVGRHCQLPDAAGVNIRHGHG